MIELWVDGSCVGDNIGVGIVIIDGAKRISIGKRMGCGTSNEAELHAIRYALICAMPMIKTQECTIYSDSMYAIGSIMNGHGSTKIHSEIVKLLGMIKGYEFVHIKGHQGNGYNELADALAGMAVAGKEVLDDSEH